MGLREAGLGESKKFLGGEDMWGIFLGWALLLAAYDLRWRRLPDVLTIPAALGVCAAAFVLQPVALVGGVLWAGTQLLVAGMLARQRGAYPLGGGDIKLSLSLGVLSWWAAGYLGVLAAMGVSSLLSAMIMGLMRKRDVAHGPAMLVATATVMLFGGW